MNPAINTLLMAAEALAFMATAAVSVLTYRTARKTHTVADSNRRDTNRIVSRLAYVTGRQDALVQILGDAAQIDPAQLARLNDMVSPDPSEG